MRRRGNKSRLKERKEEGKRCKQEKRKKVNEMLMKPDRVQIGVSAED